MSTSLSIRRLYHLVKNPFEPARAELRNPEEIVIIGKQHRGALDTIVALLEQCRYPYLIVLHGDWGTGKTAIIKRAMYELEQELKDKIITLYYRIPREGEGLPIGELILNLAIELFKVTSSRGILLDNRLSRLLKRWVKEEEVTQRAYNERIKRAREILLGIIVATLRQGKKLVLVLDQFENLSIEQKNDRNFIFLIREIFDNAGKYGQVFLIFSALTSKLREMFDDDIWGKFIRASKILEVGPISREEAVALFKTLLEKYREPEYREKLRERREELLPFTIDAVEEIWRLGERIPGRIYNLAGNVLASAAQSGIDKIDVTVVRYLAGEYSLRWIDAVESMPYMSIGDLIQKILEASRKLFDIIYVKTEILTKENVGSFLKLKRNLSERDLEKLITNWRRGANYFVHYYTGEREKLSVIKVSEKLIRRDTIDCLHRALSLSTPLFMGKPVPPIDITIALVTGGRITSSASYGARGLEVAFGIKVLEKVIDTSEPRSYGRIRALVEDILNIEEIHGDLHSAPEDQLEQLKRELAVVLRLIGVYISEFHD